MRTYNLILSLILVLIMLNFVNADSYPSPFVSGGKPECKIACVNSRLLYDESGNCYCSGSNKSPFELKEAGNVQANLQQFQQVELYGGVTSLESQTPTKEKTQELRDCEKHGCYEDLGKKCYQFGYIRDGTYCSEKAKVYASNMYVSGFVNQSETSSSCIQGYECKTGVCSNNICVNLTEQQNKINLLVDNLSKLSQENTGLSEGSNNSSSESYQIPEKNDNIIQKIANLLKTWFGI